MLKYTQFSYSKVIFQTENTFLLNNGEIGWDGPTLHKKPCKESLDEWSLDVEIIFTHFTRRCNNKADYFTTAKIIVQSVSLTSAWSSHATDEKLLLYM